MKLFTFLLIVFGLIGNALADGYGSSGSSAQSYGSSGVSRQSYGSTGVSAINYGSSGSAVYQEIMRRRPVQAAVITPAVVAVRVAAVPVRAAVAVAERVHVRWQNHDGLTRKQHAQQVHGIDTRGMTEAQASMAADHDHDVYGGQHSHAMRSKSATVPAMSSCPGGVCPTNRTASRPFLFPLLRR